MDAGTDGSSGMDEARRDDRPRTGRTANGDTTSQDVAPNHVDDEEVVRSVRDWTRRTARARSPHASLLVHWIDEKGAVVRLITSGDSDADAPDAS
jgi:hypothetical protein